ncbi:MAG: diacylglycerol/lipid kinase family protein [Bacilli bacterium]
MKTCELICNQESGKGIKGKVLEEVIKKLEEHDYKTNLYFTEKNGDAKNYVKNLKQADLVLSIGGDGTFNEIVTGNYQRKEKLILSHIPVGTTNDIGHMLGLNKSITKNVEKILEGEVKQVDLGLINEQPFFYVAGFGKFINVPYQTSRKLKKKLGHLAYLINGLKEFFQTTKLYELEYKIDGVTYHGFYSLILISNANRIAGFNNIYKNVKLDDDKFEIMFCNITRRKDLVKTIILLVKTGITNVPGIYCHTSNEIEINFKEKIKNNWTIDGEKLKDEQKKYKITINKDLKMLLPKKNIPKLFTK